MVVVLYYMVVVLYYVIVVLYYVIVVLYYSIVHMLILRVIRSYSQLRCSFLRIFDLSSSLSSTFSNWLNTSISLFSHTVVRTSIPISCRICCLEYPKDSKSFMHCMARMYFSIQKRRFTRSSVLKSLRSLSYVCILI